MRGNENRKLWINKLRGCWKCAGWTGTESEWTWLLGRAADWQASITATNDDDWTSRDNKKHTSTSVDLYTNTTSAPNNSRKTSRVWKKWSASKMEKSFSPLKKIWKTVHEGFIVIGSIAHMQINIQRYKYIRSSSVMVQWRVRPASSAQ